MCYVLRLTHGNVWLIEQLKNKRSDLNDPEQFPAGASVWSFTVQAKAKAKGKNIQIKVTVDRFNARIYCTPVPPQVWVGSHDVVQRAIPWLEWRPAVALLWEIADPCLRAKVSSSGLAQFCGFHDSDAPDSTVRVYWVTTFSGFVGMCDQTVLGLWGLKNKRCTAWAFFPHCVFWKLPLQ